MHVLESAATPGHWILRRIAERRCCYLALRLKNARGVSISSALFYYPRRFVLCKSSVHMCVWRGCNVHTCTHNSPKPTLIASRLALAGSLTWPQGTNTVCNLATGGAYAMQFSLYHLMLPEPKMIGRFQPSTTRCLSI